ncbi:type II toxin-antitoxin system Phd/YefM family antitoxin [Desulfococcaceae bacterium HSG8]|nr:type II toxin-antitoxin system Phd/YefM family antitoxin [Desulfococcaceae bacterium HSG8]
MEKVTVEILQNDLPAILSRVSDEQEPISVFMKPGREVVLVDSEDYNSIMETLHLLRTPADTERLMEGIKQHRQGKKREINVEAYPD